MALKHKGLHEFIKTNNTDIIAVLKTKLNTAMLHRLVSATFRHWDYAHNFESHSDKRILLLWNLMKVKSLNVSH